MNLPASDGVAHLELAAGVHTEPDDLIGQRVAHNLLRLRGKRNLSLDALARISGVSRAMLAQIESGRSVPSIKVLCKIAQGLKVSVAAFLDDRAFAGVAVLPAQQSKRLVSADGAFTSRALFPFDVARQVEFYELRLRGLGQEDAEAHAPGTQENLVVAQGYWKCGSTRSASCSPPATRSCSTPTSRTATAIPPIAKPWRTW